MRKPVEQGLVPANQRDAEQPEPGIGALLLK
jgi:hypothetical protein